MKRIFVILGATLTALTAWAGNGQPTLIGWNNLGMHCMDDDYTVFSILPPFNTIDAHLIDAQGRLVKDPNAYTVTYEGWADPDGSINTFATGKTNFWDYSAITYGAPLNPETGLFGAMMPGRGNPPRPMVFGTTQNWYEALGIPITPIDDAGHPNPYPMMRLKARNGSGQVVAETSIVLPVSGEMDCRACHASNSGTAARPAGGWVNDPNPKRDYRLNILKLHDEERGTSLLASAMGGAPVLCAACHKSEALPGSGKVGIPPLTESMHGFHAAVLSPANGLPLDSASNRSACYQCHPGSTTRCLRGAMGSAVASDGSMSMQCQSCHGTMSQVGANTRTGWLDEPTCQQCHTGSATSNSGQIRYTSALVGGTARAVSNLLFGTNPDTPAAGVSLYRFSKGHGGLQCAACHGSTHAEFPSSHRNDNIQSLNLQGHAGMLVECTACHATMTSGSATYKAGPHGMHPIGSSWAQNHADLARLVPNYADCKTCHGSDLRGTVLSRVQGDRTVSTEFGTRQFWRGYEVGCYDCHNGPTSSNPTAYAAPTVSNRTLAVQAGQPAKITLTASGVSSPKFRIVRQPAHGSVALTATTGVGQYFPEPGYDGPDTFTYAATDSLDYRDSSTAGVVSVTVGSGGATVDSDNDGLSNLVEYALGTSPDFFTDTGLSHPAVENTGGVPYLTLSGKRWQSPSDVTISFQVSSDLVSWSPAAMVISSGTLLKARDTQAATGGGSRFIRMQVSRP